MESTANTNDNDVDNGFVVGFTIGSLFVAVVVVVVDSMKNNWMAAFIPLMHIINNDSLSVFSLAKQC